MNEKQLVKEFTRALTGGKNSKVSKILKDMLTLHRDIIAREISPTTNNE